MAKEAKGHLTKSPSVIVDLNSEIAELNSQPALQTSGRVAKTFTVHPNFRIVLNAMRKGARITVAFTAKGRANRLGGHHVPGNISIHSLRGEIALHIHNQVTKLPAGSILVLDRAADHDVVAQEDSAFLLTVAWPNKQK